MPKRDSDMGREYCNSVTMSLPSLVLFLCLDEGRLLLRESDRLLSAATNKYTLSIKLESMECINVNLMDEME